MKRRFSVGRPSPAMVVALIALFASVAGGAYAAATIDGADIVNGSITKKDLHKNSVTTKKVKNKTLRANDFAPGQLQAGVQGIQGLKGDKGEKGDTGDTGPIGPSTGYGASTPDGLNWTGSPQVVQTLNLPGGNYVVSGHVFSNNNTAANAIVDCDLQVNGTAIADGDDLVRQGNNDQPAERLFLDLHAVVNLPADGTVTASCDTDQPTGQWTNRVLTAVKVGNIG